MLDSENGQAQSPKVNADEKQFSLNRAASKANPFHSDGLYPDMGKLDYCLRIAAPLELKPADLFLPAPDGQKAVRRRKF